MQAGALTWHRKVFDLGYGWASGNHNYAGPGPSNRKWGVFQRFGEHVFLWDWMPNRLVDAEKHGDEKEFFFLTGAACRLGLAGGTTAFGLSGFVGVFPTPEGGLAADSFYQYPPRSSPACARG